MVLTEWVFGKGMGFRLAEVNVRRSIVLMIALAPTLAMTLK